jgi:hypothetical protein
LFIPTTVAVACTVGLPSCGSSDDAGSETAEPVYAPQLSDLRIGDTVTATESLTAMVHASDEDGLAEIRFRVKFTLGGSSAEAETKLQGIPAGTIASDISLMLPFNSVGEYEIEIVAIDVDGNESNALNAAVTSVAAEAAADE